MPLHMRREGITKLFVPGAERIINVKQIYLFTALVEIYNNW